MRLYLLFLMLGLSLFAASCQSPRAVALFPAVREYGRAVVLPPSTTASAHSEPVLTAVLPESTAAISSLSDEQLARPSSSVSRPEPLPADTTLKKKEAIILSSKADPTTTVVNAVGGVMTAAGVAVMVVSANAKTGGEWGGLADFMSGFMGFMLALAGVALLFFQGKNGRLRRLREARRAARLAIVSPASAPDTPQVVTAVVAEPKSHRRKTGLKLVITSGVLLLLSFLPIAFLPLILGFVLAPILLIIGLVFMLAGE